MIESERLDWAQKVIGEYAFWLGVPHAWRIDMVQDDAECKAREVRAFVHRDAKYLQARVSFSADVNDDERGRETVVHELLHLCFADLEQLCKEIAEQLSPAAADLFRQRFEHTEEQAVTLMARGLRRAFDRIPEEKKAFSQEWLPATAEGKHD